MSTKTGVRRILNFAGETLAGELEQNNFKVGPTGTATGMFSVDYEEESNTRIELLQSVVSKHSPNAAAYVYKRI